MNHALDRDIIAIEQQLLNVASQIEDLIEDCMAIPEDESPDVKYLEDMMNYIRENL